MRDIKQSNSAHKPLFSLQTPHTVDQYIFNILYWQVLIGLDTTFNFCRCYSENEIFLIIVIYLEYDLGFKRTWVWRQSAPTHPIIRVPTLRGRRQLSDWSVYRGWKKTRRLNRWKLCMIKTQLTVGGRWSSPWTVRCPFLPWRGVCWIPCSCLAVVGVVGNSRDVMISCEVRILWRCGYKILRV